MLFSVPITSKETIVDTPLNCRSLRSFHFFDRYGSTKQLDINGRGLRGFVTIIIDGKVVCKDLYIMPFMESQSEEMSSIRPSQDWRRISIPCLKNCDMSTIKIITDDDALDYEVVFEYSDVEVEDEHFSEVESRVVMVDSPIPAFSNTISVKSGEEFQIETHEGAEEIFCVVGAIIGGSAGARAKIPEPSIEYMDGFKMSYATNYYAKYSEYPEDCPSAQFKLTISDYQDAMPKRMPVDIFSVSSKKAWKEMAYQFNEPLSKRFKLTIDSDGVTSVIAEDGYAVFALVIYLIHECKF